MPLFIVMQKPPPHGSIAAVSPSVVFQFPTIGSAALASPVDISSAVTEIRMGFTVRSPRMAGPPPGR
ncbi:hypothetical protein GFM29_37215 [Rhizobium leguminosarum bv. viciae]|nr:hypothetical protein [Rhizobium leguminosarum bv. viciae]